MLMISRVNENASFSAILEKHLKPGPWNHQLRKFCEEELDCLKLFIRKYPKVVFVTSSLVKFMSPLRWSSHH